MPTWVPLMAKIIVADTGPLIALALVDLLPLLPTLFSAVYVPETVLREATRDISRPGAQAIQTVIEKGLIIVQSVTLSKNLQDLIDVLDQGEAEALSLAQELNAMLLIDERRGRKVALKHGVAIIGSAAMLIKAKQQGLITKVKPLIEKLNLHGYRMSDHLITEILSRVDEQ